ncbi:TPA: hypothetical protein U5D50_004286 [Yersinia enterocolitica]|nr:hypothetical protein [Yersinia enterocolitica]
MNFTFDDLTGDTQNHIEHFLALTPEEIQTEVDFLAGAALADVEMLHADDDELQQRTTESINELKPQLIEMLQSKAAEHQKTAQNQEAEQAEDLIYHINRNAPERSIISVVENGDIIENVDTLRVPFYVKELERRLLLDNASPSKFVSHCNIDDNQFNAYYIKSGDKLILTFASDEDHFKSRLIEKGITDYVMVDFRKEFETEAEQEKKKAFLKEYSRYQLAIDMTLTMNAFTGVKERDLFYFIFNLMVENQNHHKELLAKYYKNLSDNLEHRESIVNGITEVTERIHNGIKNGTITIEAFDKKVSDSLVDKLKEFRDKSGNSSEKPMLDKLLLKYNFNVLRFRDKMNNAKQKIEDANQAKQGVKK